MPQDIAKYAKERAEARASGSWFKLKEGENCFRILPTPPSGDLEAPFVEYNMHRDVGPRKLGVRCGVDPVSREGKCWLCDVKIPALRKKGHETRAAALAPKPVFLIQVAKVDGEDMKGPFLFTPAKTLADQLLTACFANTRRSVVDPKKGYNLYVQRSGTGRNDTRYGSPEYDAKPTMVPKSILAKLLSFDDLKEVPKYSAAKQQAVYAGRDVVDEVDEEEEDDMPTPKSRKGKTKPVVEPDEDEEEEDEETDDEADSEDEDAEESDDEAAEDEDEDEEPAPKKKAKKPAPVVKKKKKPQPEEDEDEDEESEDEDAEDEDEDEEPAPVVKKKKKPAPEPEPEEDEDEDEEPEDEDSEDEDEDEPAPKKVVKKKTVEKVQVAVKKKKKPEPEPEEEDDEEEDEDEDLDTADIPDEDEEDEEEVAPPKKKVVAAKPVKKKKR